jgi:eukaryotic-like serine/threonine-protein kinase
MTESTEYPSSRAEELIQRCLDTGAPRESLERACAENLDLALELRERFALLEAMGMLSLEATHRDGSEDDVRDDEGDDNLGDDGDWFGGFRLVEQLGKGGMGVVFLAEQPKLERQVALKLIREEYLDSARAKARFRQEVRAVSGIDHPGICTVYEAGEVDGTPYIAMRYIKGDTLARRLSRARSDSSTHGSNAPTTHDEVFSLVALIEKVARAVHVAHETGLIHRDIKPANIIVGEDGEPVLLDFGLARPEESTGHGITLSGDIIGTPAYMSPEQISSKGRTLDRRADVYALGVTLFECLTHTLPFRAPTREELYRHILDSDAPDSTRFNRMIPRDLQIVLATAMEREPTRRYATALDLAEDLRRVRTFEPISARRPSPPERLWRWARRKPLAAAFAVVLFTATGLSGYVLATWSTTNFGEETLRQRRFEDHLAAGYVLFQRRHYDHAIEEFSVALEERPGAVEAIVGIAISEYDARGRKSILAAKLLDAYAGRSSAVRRLAAWMRGDALGDAPRAGVVDMFVEAYISMKSHDRDSLRRAHDLLARAIMQSPTARLYLHVALCDAAGRLEDEAAIRDATTAISTLFPNHRHARVTTAFNLRFLDPEEALETCLALYQEFPDDRAILDVLVQVYTQRGDPDEAVALCARRIARHVDRFPAKLHVMMAEALLNSGRVSESVRVLRDAVKKWPDHFELVAFFATALHSQGDNAASKVEYERAVKLGGERRPRLLWEYGHVLLELREFERAEEYLRKSIAGNPADCDAHYFLGRLLQQQNRPGEAEKELLEANRLDPADPRVHFSLGWQHAFQGEPAKARKAYEKAVDLDPRHARANFALARVEEKNGDLDAAERYYRQALRSNTEYAEAFCNLALMIARRGRALEALPLIRKGHELGSARANWKYHSQQWVNRIEASATAEKRVLRYLDGDAIVGTFEQGLALLRLAQARHRYLDGRRALEKCFAEHPELQDAYGGTPRYWVIQLAARAGLGDGAKSAALTDAERSTLLRAARNGLQSELQIARHSATREERSTARRRIEWWIQDVELKGVRDTDAVDALPAPARSEFRKLWNDVRKAGEELALDK